MYQIKIKKLDGYNDLPLPQKMSDYASGYDIYAAIEEPVILKPGERRLIPTGFSLEMPPGIEAQIRPRSGLALRNGITMVNTPGTIDADYRGHVQIILINLGEEDFTINRGERLAQLVFMQLPEVSLTLVAEVSDSNRGAGGFGHTGK